MKRKSTELDVDFIGGQTPLTKSEEDAISKFIKARKLIKAKQDSAIHHRRRIDASRRIHLRKGQ